MRLRRFTALCWTLLVLHGGWVVAAPPTGKPAPAKVYAALKASSLKVRLKAVEILAHSGDPAAPPVLVPLLADGDPVMRSAVCDALAAMTWRAAVPDIKALVSDEDELVKRRAGAALKVLVVPLDSHQSSDTSNSGLNGLEALLKRSTNEALGQVAFVDLRALSSGEKGYAVQLVVQAVRDREEGTDHVVEVVTAATVTEMPANALRFSTRITAGAALGSPPSPAMRQELAEDAVKSASAALAEEVAAWLNKPR